MLTADRSRPAGPGRLPAGIRPRAHPRTAQKWPTGAAPRPPPAAPSSHERLLSPRHPRSPLAETEQERVVNAPNVPGPDQRGSLTAPAGTAAAASGLTAPDRKSVV